MDLTLNQVVILLVLGLIAGFLASLVMKGGFGIVGDMVIGVVGSFLGNFLAGLLGIGGGSDLNLRSIIIAFIGAVIIIAIYRAVTHRRRPTHYRRRRHSRRRD